MRFKHTVKQKSKIAIFLFGVMACTILIRFLEDKSIKEMNNAFVSMYNLYAKRYLLESMIEKKSTESKVDLIKKLGVHDANIISLISKYEKTFLTPQEKKYLEDLKAQLQANNKIERVLLDDKNITNQEEFIIQTDNSFNEITKKITELTQLQRNVGEELIKDSNFLVSGSNLYSNIQFGLAIVIGILIVAIITTSNVVKVANEKFNMN
jgi:hypothetical protein